MKPDGIAKNGNPYWNLYRVPTKVLMEQQASNMRCWPTGIIPHKPKAEEDVKIIGGIKCFEKPGKLVLMYVISNARTKRYEYKWMASIIFKKTGVMLLLNKKEWTKPGKAFCNATYKTGEWDMIVSKAISGFPLSLKQNAKLPTMNQRRLAFSRRLNEMIVWKAKKEKLPIGKLNRVCARKTDFTLFRLAVGSELMSNQIYYFLKNNPKTEMIKFDAAPVNHKKYRFFIKHLRKQKSMEKICKKIFGRNTKYIMKAVQARLIHSHLEKRPNNRHEAVDLDNLEAGYGAQIMERIKPENVGGITTRQMAIFDLSIFVFGYYIKDWVNLDKMQNVFQDIAEETRACQTTFDLMPDWLQMLNGKPVIERFLVHLGEARTERILKQIWSMEFKENQPAGNGLMRAAPDNIARRFGYLRDTASQWSEKADKIVIPNNIKGLDEIHDYVSIEYRKLSSSDFDLKFKDEVLAINGTVLEGGLRLELPKTNFHLVAWGQKMNNCIGGYGRQVNDSKNRQWLLGVYKNDMLTYNIEVYDKHIRQFWGARNTQADPKDKVTVLKFLADKELAREQDMNESLRELQRALEAGMYNQPVGDAQEVMQGLNNMIAQERPDLQLQDIQVNLNGNQVDVNINVRADQAVDHINFQINEGDVMLAGNPRDHIIQAARNAVVGHDENGQMIDQERREFEVEEHLTANLQAVENALERGEQIPPEGMPIIEQAFSEWHHRRNR